jgi:type VI secretion system protein ImpH
LNDDLFREPYRFDFFQAVRLLERWRRERDELRPGASDPAAPVGHDEPSREAVRFVSQASLSFPAAAIAEARPPGTTDAGGRARPGAPRPVAGPEPSSSVTADAAGSLSPPGAAELVVTFLGLTGPSGVLPRHYTELLLRRVREKDTTFRDFLDLFHHRLISLFYRAWEKHRLAAAYERSQLEGRGEPDLATQGLYSLVGLGTGGLRGRLEVDDEAFLYFSGHFAHFPRSAAALEGLLTDYLEMPVRVQSLQGQWLRLEKDDQSATPGPSCPAGRNNQLGVDAVVGERVWDVQSKVRIRLGPLSGEQFRSLLPLGPGLKPLAQLVRSYVGPELDFDIQPILRAGDVPSGRLGGPPGLGSYLGWNCWVGSQPFTHNVDDAVFTIPDL